MLMQKLGVVASSPNVDSETVHKYKSTFQAPLSASKQEALHLLFSGEFDPLVMNLDMVGMDEVEVYPCLNRKMVSCVITTTCEKCERCGLWVSVIFGLL